MSTRTTRPSSSSGPFQRSAGASSEPTTSTTSLSSASARTTSRCSPVPIASRWSESIAPLPLNVVTTGEPNRSASCCSSDACGDRAAAGDDHRTPSAGEEVSGRIQRRNGRGGGRREDRLDRGHLGAPLEQVQRDLDVDWTRTSGAHRRERLRDRDRDFGDAGDPMAVGDNRLHRPVEVLGLVQISIAAARDGPAACPPRHEQDGDRIRPRLAPARWRHSGPRARRSSRHTPRRPLARA